MIALLVLLLGVAGAHKHVDVASGKVVWSAVQLDAVEQRRTERSWFGPSTCLLDWCEDNYLWSRYVAEFWNTLSNVCLVGLGVYGLLWARRQHRWPIVVSFLALTAVGVGSAMFHVSLTHTGQLFDELPMIWANSVFAWANTPPQRRAAWWTALCVFYSVFVTLVYTFVYHDAVFHEWAYAVGVVTVVAQSAGNLSRCENARDRANLLLLFKISVLAYGVSFLVWNAENTFCETVRAYRRAVGPLFAPLLELHAWWHAGSAYGTYVYICFNTYASLAVHGSRSGARLRFVARVIPTVDKLPLTAAKHD